MKREFEVLLTATMQKSFVIEAADGDEAHELLERRWTAGDGGEIQHNDLACVDVQFDVVRTFNAKLL